MDVNYCFQLSVKMLTADTHFKFNYINLSTFKPHLIFQTKFVFNLTYSKCKKLSAIIRKNWQHILRRRVYIIEHYTIVQAHVSGASNIK